MNINLNLILKLFFTNLFIFFSLYFFYSGYFELNKSITKNSNLTLNVKGSLETKKNKFLQINEEEIIKKLDEKNVENEIIINIKKNDTFSKIIDPYIIDKKNKYEIIRIINQEYDLRKLKINQKIYLYLSKDNKITKIVIPLNFNLDLVLQIDQNNIYSIKKEKLSIHNQLNSIKYQITQSLYQDGRKANVPVPILSEIIKLYSFDIDFQRDIQKGDKIKFLYESFYNIERRTVSYGKVLYIKLYLQKKELEYYLFKTDEDFYDYFNNEGKNVKKALMKTPLDGARLSSSFGMRKHPILGFDKLHKGVDFAAPKGTPIYAAGNGVIEYKGNNGGYGKYIRIRHNNSYKTAYAHLNNYNKGINGGVRVDQGDIIGYVGSSGKSTGPHLHYEIIFKNKQINPMKIKLPSGKVLKEEELKRFKKEIKLIYSDYLFNLYE